MRRVVLHRSHPRGKEALCASSYHIILRLEPRASSLRTQRTHRAADVAPAGMRMVVYTQGGVPGHSREACTPAMVPGVHTHGCT